MSTTCRNCGEAHEGDVAYCPSCGAAISDRAMSRARDAVVAKAFVVIFVLGVIAVPLLGQAGMIVGVVGGTAWAFWDGNRKGLW